MARLILCADDFAFSPATSGVIADLLGRGKLNATGCMTARPNWPDDSRLLHDVPAGAEIGLHLTLTEEAPAVPGAWGGRDRLPGIHELHRLAGQGALAAGDIAAEVEAQFDRFEGAMGRPPAFVDGHQHAHALPVIREVVLATTARRAPRAWVRTCEDGALAMLARPWRGKALASAFHSRGLRRDAGRHGLSCNRGFAGHYGFAGDYAAIFPHFLDRPGETHLVMCHPGTDDRPGDAIAAARVEEAAALRRLPVAELAAARGLAFPA